MKKALPALLTLLFVVSTVSFGFARPPLSAGQDKLMAKRAAQVDAYRKLMEEIKGIRINATTTVRDFITQSDQISTAFEGFMKGLKLHGSPRYLPDGTCEVDVKVTLMQVMRGLKRVHLDYPSGKKFTFDQMTDYTKKTVFTATGVGVPPSQAGPFGKKAVSAKTEGIPGWEKVTPQGRLLAERGALTDARRNLSERVKGLRVTGNTLVKDFAVLSDQVNTNLDTFVKGVKENGPYRYLPDGICEVDVQVTTQKVITELTTIRDRYRVDLPPQTVFREVSFEKILDWDPPKVLEATGSAAVPREGSLRTGGYQYGERVDPDIVAVIPGTPPAWANETVRATGRGLPKEGETGAAARLGAQRAAEADARRRLIERVYGVQIDGRTSVRDFVMVNDEIETRISQFLAGARMVGEPRELPDGSMEVTMELPLERLWIIISEM